MGFLSFKRGHKSPSSLIIPDCSPTTPHYSTILHQFSQEIGSASSASSWVIPDAISHRIEEAPCSSTSLHAPESPIARPEVPPLGLRGGNMEDFSDCDPDSPGALERYQDWIDQEFVDEDWNPQEASQDDLQIRTQYPADTRPYSPAFRSPVSVDDSDTDEEMDDFSYGRQLGCGAFMVPGGDSEDDYDSGDGSDYDEDNRVINTYRPSPEQITDQDYDGDDELNHAEAGFETLWNTNRAIISGQSSERPDSWNLSMEARQLISRLEGLSHESHDDSTPAARPIPEDATIQEPHGSLTAAANHNNSDDDDDDDDEAHPSRLQSPPAFSFAWISPDVWEAGLTPDETFRRHGIFWADLSRNEIRTTFHDLMAGMALSPTFFRRLLAAFRIGRVVTVSRRNGLVDDSGLSPAALTRFGNGTHDRFPFTFFFMMPHELSSTTATTSSSNGFDSNLLSFSGDDVLEFGDGVRDHYPFTFYVRYDEGGDGAEQEEGDEEQEFGDGVGDHYPCMFYVPYDEDEEMWESSPLRFGRFLVLLDEGWVVVFAD